MTFLAAVGAVCIAASAALVMGGLWCDFVRQLGRRRRALAAQRKAPSPFTTSLVDVTPLHLVTPRGVEIPSNLLQGDLDLADCLDWLDYVETLG